MVIEGAAPSYLKLVYRETAAGDAINDPKKPWAGRVCYREIVSEPKNDGRH